MDNASGPERSQFNVPGTPSCFHTAPDRQLRPLLTLNQALTEIGVPHNINEGKLSVILTDLELTGLNTRPAYWLMMARLTEAALLCAGNYADNCEFEAAGDLLVNPRKVVVHGGGDRPSMIKQRHGRLSDQLRACMSPGAFSMAEFRRHGRIEIVRPALLPELAGKMARAGYLTGQHLERVNSRMRKIADTIGFLSAWFLSSATDLYQRMAGVSPSERQFIEDNLCRFDRRCFDRLGEEIDQLNFSPDVSGVPDVVSEYLLLHGPRTFSGP